MLFLSWEANTYDPKSLNLRGSIGRSIALGSRRRNQQEAGLSQSGLFIVCDLIGMLRDGKLRIIRFGL